MVSLPLFQRVEANAYNKNLAGVKSDPTDYFSASAAQWDLPGKDTVVIALTQEPASMFSLAESAAVQHVVAQLVWGSGVTQYAYDYQPVIQEGDVFPTIENGGAVNNEVELKDGDRIANANGDVGTLKDGKLVGDDGTELSLVGRDAAGNDVEIKVGAKLPQLVVTAKLKPGLKWSDGQPVVKADWELGFKVECNKESGAVTYYGCDRTAKFEALDDVTAVTTFVPGYQPPTYYLVAPLAGLTGGVGVYPSHQVVNSEGAYKGKTLAEVDPKDFKTLPEIAETPMGTGPYILKSWEKGQKMTLEANPNYWGGEVKVKNIVVQFFADTNGAVTGLLQGDVDIIGKETLGAGTELEAVVNAAKEGKVIAEVSASPTWEHIDMNLNIR
jgi:ABC-type transport system substrate-binding protein